jgi:integrase
MTTVTNFLSKHANYIWTTSALHRKESLAKMQVFLDYDNNAVKRVDEISGADIIDFCHWLKDTRKISENTINHYRSALSRYFNYAKDYLDLPKIPNIKFVKVTNQRVRFYSRTEIKKIRDHLRGHQHTWLLPMFNIGITTGMRLGEILRVRRRNVVLIGNDVRHIHLAETKNGESRNVPLSDEAFDAFEQLNWNAETMFIEGAHYYAWNKIRHNICNGDKAAVFHCTRHTAATVMANEMNINHLLIGAMLGHKDPSSTMKYVHTKAETMGDIAAQLAASHYAIK